jgi:predicted DCC family thiol-disulfide oxidoreductase YuxK
LLYDGQCPFCARSVRLAKRLDWLERLKPVDLVQASRLELPQPVSAEQLLEQMHLITPGGSKIYRGFEALRWLAWRLPLLWPLAPLLYVPGMARLGQRLYLAVARNRFRLVPCHGGVCRLPEAATTTSLTTPHRAS